MLPNNDPTLFYALQAALQHFRAAAELEPGFARFAYVYGIALNSLGFAEDASEVLGKARKSFPEDYDIAWALATIIRDRGDIDTARSLAEEMLAQFPDDANFRALLQSLPSATLR